MTRLRTLSLLAAAGALALWLGVGPVPEAGSAPGLPALITADTPSAASCCSEDSPAEGAACCGSGCRGVDTSSCSRDLCASACPYATSASPVGVFSAGVQFDPQLTPAGTVALFHQAGSSRSIRPPVPPPLFNHSSSC